MTSKSREQPGLYIDRSATERTPRAEPPRDSPATTPGGGHAAPASARILVFFPTFNEAGNVERLIQTIWQYLPEADILVVDDASPDGTGAILDRIAAGSPRLSVVHRPGKLGLGSAHKLAMLRARDAGYDELITMDADFSHHPRYLPTFVELLKGADFVTGSRYMPGGRSDYGLGRTIISRTANLFAKAALGLPLEENTTMYRGFSSRLLARMNIDSIRSEGYSFAVESLNQVASVTDRLAEFPIHFENRATGASKISKREIYRAIATIQRLGVRRLLPTGRDRAVEQGPVVCVLCKGTHHLEVYPAKDEARGTSLRDASPYSCATHSTRSHGQILKCLGCGLVFMRPRLEARELVSEYAEAIDPVYLDHIDARITTFRYNLARVRRHFRAGARVLEIGSYCGAFLKVARDEGIDVMGVEPSAWAVNAAAHVVDAPVVRGTTADLPPDARSFDVVVAWDVLEHFADPVAECRRINDLLPEGGLFLFSTLMIDNWFPRVTGKHWPWLMDMHLFYFTESTVRTLLAETGFEVVEDMKYCHVVTFDYLLTKLGTLGVPLAGPLAGVAAQYSAARTEIPFRFGDIKLFVCRKVGDAPVESAPRASAHWSEAPRASS